ncbi:monooxygenase [Cytidiella melzeri]|nr:monooxygenase [Cytidiella melzeri]
MSAETSVLIVGAGPSGLILALALRQNNIPVRIIEKDVIFHRGQRGSGIQPRSLELFNSLGSLDDIMKEGIPPVQVAIYEPNGKDIAKKQTMVEIAEPTPDVPFRNPHMIGQSHNEEIHRRHLAKYDTVVELGTELVGLTQDEDGVTAQVLCRKDGQESKQTIRVKYLVSAEGARSVARKELDIRFLGQTHDAMRLAIADMHLKGVTTDYWHQFGDIGSKAVWIRPTEHDGVFSVMAGGKDCDVDLLSTDRQALLDTIVEVTKRDNLEFGEMVWQTSWRANVRMVEKFGKGRVFLVGGRHLYSSDLYSLPSNSQTCRTDAAHVHSPTGGQGLNTGVQDSFNLAWKLSLALKYPSVPRALLESYETERLPVVRDMLFRTSELLKQTANYKLKGGTEATHLRRPQILHQIGVNYRGSPVVVEEQAKEEGEEEVSGAYRPEDPSVLKAGDRAPDSAGLLRVEGSGEEKNTLFGIFRPNRHTVLLFGEDEETVEVLKNAPTGAIYTVRVVSKKDEAAGAGVDAVFVDSEGHAHTFYPPAAKGFKVIIVRPDGVVGAIARGREGAGKYLKGVFGV